MERYDELGTYLAENGVLVFGHDHGEILILVEQLAWVGQINVC